MDYIELFDTIRRHLDLQGVECETAAGKPVSDRALSKIESSMQIRLPAELREFYLVAGDGFSFCWQSDPEDPEKPFANLEIPPLKHLASMYAGWREMALFTPEQAEKYGFPHTDDPALAKRTAAEMWHWLPVIEEDNGDMICLDLGDPSCPAIFNRHDWLDGGTGDNGHVLATDLRAFLTAWGSVCFQCPESLYWPSCFLPGGGVDWGVEQFHRSFRLTRIT